MDRMKEDMRSKEENKSDRDIRLKAQMKENLLKRKKKVKSDINPNDANKHLATDAKEILGG